jgi:hypothetical protein
MPVVLTAYGNVPPERAAQFMGMLLGVAVSVGWVDKAATRVSARLSGAGFDDAMTAALAGEKALPPTRPGERPGQDRPAGQGSGRGG